jgi:hypothetical protein
MRIAASQASKPTGQFPPIETATASESRRFSGIGATTGSPRNYAGGSLNPQATASTSPLPGLDVEVLVSANIGYAADCLIHFPVSLIAVPTYDLLPVDVDHASGSQR